MSVLLIVCAALLTFVVSQPPALIITECGGSAKFLPYSGSILIHSAAQCFRQLRGFSKNELIVLTNFWRGPCDDNSAVSVDDFSYCHKPDAVILLKIHPYVPNIHFRTYSQENYTVDFYRGKITLLIT